jgi:hypothetical protein
VLFRSAAHLGTSAVDAEALDIGTARGAEPLTMCRRAPAFAATPPRWKDFSAEVSTRALVPLRTGAPPAEHPSCGEQAAQQSAPAAAPRPCLG